MTELIRLRRLRRGKYDVLCKFLWPVTRTKFQHYLGISDGKELSVEFSDLSQVRVDTLTEAEDAIHHVEFQTTNDPEMHWRMLDYYLRIGNDYDVQVNETIRPIKQSVIYIGNDEVDMLNTLKGKNLDFRFELYDIRVKFAQNAKELLSSGQIDNKILGLLSSVNLLPQVWLEVGRAIASIQQTQKRNAERYFCLLYLAALLRNLDDDTSKELLKMSKVIDIEKSPIFRDVFDTGECEGVLWSIQFHCEENAIPIVQDHAEKLADYPLDALRVFYSVIYRTNDLGHSFEEADKIAHPSQSITL